MDNSSGVSAINNDAIAINVLKEYGITPEKLSLIQGGTIKTVWKFHFRNRRYCLKRLKQTYDKALFSVNAQIYIKNNGGKVPAIALNNEKQPITKYNGQLFVLYEWIDGRDLNFNIGAEFRQAVQGLARFHTASKGYRPAGQFRVSTKLGKWPEQYESMKRKMSAWAEISSANSSLPHFKAYSANIGPIMTLADKASHRLDMSDYAELAKEGSPFVALCHQDFGRGNVLAAADGIYILDLDGVTYDLPARDLRKIIGKNAENTGRWSDEAIGEILGWYTEINPLCEGEFEVLYADLTFPHWFFGLVKNLFQNGKLVKAAEIERIAKLEISKDRLPNIAKKE